MAILSIYLNNAFGKLELPDEYKLQLGNGAINNESSRNDKNRDSKPDFYQWGIELKETGELIGTISIDAVWYSIIAEECNAGQN